MAKETVDPDRLARLAAEALIMEQHGPIRLLLGPLQALQLVGLVQLALRHPEGDARAEGTWEFGQQFVNDIQEIYRAAGADEFTALVDEGWPPEEPAPEIVLTDALGITKA